MPEASAQTINELFSAHLETPEGKEKVAAVAQAYVRDKLRENSFARKIIPPQMVSKTDCQVSTHHDTLVFIDEVEPNSRAMSLTFRGQPTARFIRAPRYEIPLFTISSERFEKVEQELLAYRMPITKVIEDNSVKDIQEIEDYRFLVYVEAAVQATGQIVRGEQATDDATANGAGTGFRGQVQRGDFVSLFNQLDGRRRRLGKILLNEVDFNDQLRWTIEDYGDQQQSKIVIDGYTYDRIMGRLVVRTIKTDILQTGNIYGFTSPEWLGKFLVLNNTKFYIDKQANLIFWQAWEDIGIGLGNVASIAKLELYNGQGSGDDSSDALISEEEVGTQVYNQVDDGITFPAVAQY
jgi:hypothetical protein